MLLGRNEFDSQKFWSLGLYCEVKFHTECLKLHIRPPSTIDLQPLDLVLRQ